MQRSVRLESHPEVNDSTNQLIPMKPRVILAILTLVTLTLGNCKKSSSGDNEPYNLSKTEWQGKADMYQRDFNPMKVSFKENHLLEVVFIPVDDPSAKFTFTGTWTDPDGSGKVQFQFTKGLETVTCTATLSDNNTKMADGKFKTSGDEHLDAGSFDISRQ